MKTKTLGHSKLEIASLVFGGNVFGWTIDEKTSFALLNEFVEAGFNMIDTADIYSRWAPGNKGGESETIIGRWLKDRGMRNKVLIATKLGGEMGPTDKGLSKKHMQKAVEDSLRRLQLDCIDLYQAHFDDPETPLEETLEGFASLVKAGKVKAIGASNYSRPRLQEALRISAEKKLPSFVSLQPRYNLYDRAEFEAELEPFCLENNIGVISYFSLVSGFLTGKYRSENDFSKSLRGSSMDKYMTPRGMKIIKSLDQISEQHRTSVASVALAWLMHRKSVTAPIASATSVAQLKELTAAANLVLSSDDIEVLNAASAEAELGNGSN